MHIQKARTAALSTINAGGSYNAPPVPCFPGKSEINEIHTGHLPSGLLDAGAVFNRFYLDIIVAPLDF